MATVDRLAIKGIRSFSPDHDGVITFPKPLTLIVGRNGSGKTTIIECLKHAVTGEWPPNSHSGKSFVHDPKVTDTSEVKAQIKLQFKTAAGKLFVVVRTFQLTNKKGKSEFKALDQTISTTNERGERVALSKRCADINVEVPAWMGVSKAILENVIFVHQDESNWPLSEGAVLKKKFDDIFAATKYTKALETIRKLKTDQAQGLKEKKLALETLKVHRDAAAKLRHELDDAEANDKATLEKMRELELEIKTRNARVGELRATITKISEMEASLRVEQAKRDALVLENQRRHEALESEVEGTTLERLQEAKRNVESDSRKLVAEREKLERELSDKRLALTRVAENLARHIDTQSRLAAEADMQDKRLLERQNAVWALSKAQPLIGMHFAALPTEAEVAEFGLKVQQRLRALQQEHETLLRENQARLSESTSAVDKATEAVASCTEGTRIHSMSVRRNEQRMAEITRELSEMPVAERALNEAQQNVKDVSSRLDDKRAQSTAAAYDTALQASTAKINTMKQELTRLRRERDMLSSSAGLAGQVQLLQRDADEKRDAASRLYDKCKPRLQLLCGGELPPPNAMKDRLQAVVREHEHAVTARDAELLKQRNAVAALDARMADATGNVARLTEELKVKREEVVASVLDGGDIGNFQQRLAAGEKKAQDAGQEVAEVNAFIKVTHRGIIDATEHNRCCLCSRGFANPAEQTKFLAEQQQKKDTLLPDLLRTKEGHLREATDAVAALQRARPLWEECQRLKDYIIRQAQDALRALEERHAEAAAKLSELEASAAEQQARMREVADLMADATTLERLDREASLLQGRAADQRKQLPPGESAAKSLDELSDEVLEKEEKLDEEEHKREALSAKQQRAQHEILQLERNLASVKEALAALEARADRAKGLERERLQLDAQNHKLRTDIADMEGRLAVARADKDNAERVRDNMRTAHQESDREAGAKVRALQREVDKITVQMEAIKEYVTAGKDEQLARATDAVAAARQQQATFEAEFKAQDDQLRDLANTVAKADKSKRIIDDNVAWLEGLASERALTAAIDASISARVALGDRAALQAEADKLAHEAQAFLNEQNVARGRVATYKEQIDKCRRELKEPAYKDIVTRYHHATIELRTTEMANEDLTKYHAALDKALMAFHSAKMADINKVVKELWQKTYRGQDISHIAIVSDAEATTGRSYNYRVVMNTGDTELDMRGRCSAGQRVLACLIIRLALAETFCLNCGILALDEPTTNLDAPNSTSLAEALTQIMHSRRDQENFQLIVITHDVRFAQLIGQREHAEYYWRISKDDAMHSRIEQEDIME